jgi:hypothetical protein
MKLISFPTWGFILGWDGEGDGGYANIREEYEKFEKNHKEFRSKMLDEARKHVEAIYGPEPTYDIQDSKAWHAWIEKADTPMYVHFDKLTSGTHMYACAEFAEKVLIPRGWKKIECETIVSE